MEFKKKSQGMSIGEKVEIFKQLVDKVKKVNSKEFLDFVANHLVEIASLIFRSLFLLQNLGNSERVNSIYRYFDIRAERKINYLTELTSSLIYEYGSGISDLGRKFRKVN